MAVRHLKRRPGSWVALPPWRGDQATCGSGLYEPGRLEGAAARVAAWRDAGVDVHAFFNNDHHGDAVTDAHWLVDRLDA